MTDRKRTDERVRSALLELEAPDEPSAEERARQVVDAAFDGHTPAQTRSRMPLRAGIAVVTAAAIAGFALTPAGADVREWIADTIDSAGEEDAEPRLTSLPTPGSVLVDAPSGAWVIREDGSKRHLGDYDRATWSPNGRFVGVADGSELRAIDPAGNFRWSIEAGAPVKAIDWSSDEGFRVAYIAGGELRVVTGDGVTDSAVAPAAEVPPAWQPESDPAAAVHRLTYVDPKNRVVSVATDSGRVLWRTQEYFDPVRSLEWSGDGERLLVVTGDSATIQDDEGGTFFKGPVATGVEHAAISPDGSEVAVVSSGPRGTELSLYSDTAPVRRLYSSGRQNPNARFGPPVFSPDGGWILLPWPEADQWLFVNTQDERVTAVADIARQFDADGKGKAAFPDVAGWCC
ncbi:MAG: hypothetical protein QOI31_357 [Solirubrobacterales bacterium]|jgi:hypothetical protein|nr:hypothetical protein [Solirubrobacterales bacterium]